MFSGCEAESECEAFMLTCCEAEVRCVVVTGVVSDDAVVFVQVLGADAVVVDVVSEESMMSREEHRNGCAGNRYAGNTAVGLTAGAGAGITGSFPVVSAMLSSTLSDIVSSLNS